MIDFGGDALSVCYDEVTPVLCQCDLTMCQTGCIPGTPGSVQKESILEIVVEAHMFFPECLNQNFM